MPSPFAARVLFASSLAICISYAQQQECGPLPSPSAQAPCTVKTEDYDVVVGPSKDGFHVMACGIDGRAYLERRVSGDQLSRPSWSVVGVMPNGSMVKFELPEALRADAIAAGSLGLNIVVTHSHEAHGRLYEMYHFDNQANLQAKHWLDDDFHPSMMAALSSEKTIILRAHGMSLEDLKYDGAVLDADGGVIRHFDLPLPPGGGGWTFASNQMAPGDGVAYAVLKSETTPSGPLTAIATIAETGQLDIKVIPVPQDTDQRHHNQWVFGPGVAVEVYHIVGERVTFHFDEYDLKTGDKVASKIARISGGAFGCYNGTEVSMLALSAHVDPARGLSPDTVRLVISKLQ